MRALSIRGPRVKHFIFGSLTNGAAFFLTADLYWRVRRSGVMVVFAVRRSCRIMLFETDPAMYPSAIQRQPLPRAYRRGPQVSRPGGRTGWQPSSVRMLLERAERLGLLVKQMD